MVSQIRLDFSNLPSFESTPVWVCLRPEIESKLESFPNVLERAKAAMKFRQLMGGGIPVAETDKQLMQAACLRASLMDFVGMEEVLALDLMNLDPQLKVITMMDTRNALLILLRELRHLNLHLINTNFERHDRAAVGYFGELRINQTLSIQTIPKSDIEKLRTLQNAKRFETSSYDRGIDWLLNAQNQWGIGDVVDSGIHQYARIIIDSYLTESE